MLGQEFMRQLRGQDVVGWTREDIDITSEQAVMNKINALQPSVILNCAAYNNVDKAEDEPQVAMAINGEAVGYLARAAAECGATFVHFSTDYVFSGTRTDGYHEEDLPGPISVYGQSKALGEQKLLTHLLTYSLTPWYLIRTSKLFGPPGTGETSKKSFPEMMIKIAREKGKVEAVDAEAGSPTYVKDLAQATLTLLGLSPLRVRGGEPPPDGGAKEGLRQPHPSGIYHLTNSGSCTWYEYAKAALEYAGLSNVEVVPVGPDHFPRKARRPARVVLFNTKLPPLRPWQEALKEFLTKNMA